MPVAPPAEGGTGLAVRRELLLLVVAVVVVDAMFVAGYLLFHLAAASTTAKLGYTAVWTVVTLAVVLRALTRIRSMRAGHR